MKEVAAFDGANNGYEWGEIRFYSACALALAVDYQTGCSCNGYEIPKEEDLNWCMNAQRFYAEVDSVTGDTEFWFTAAQKGEIRMAARKAWDDLQKEKWPR